MSPRTQNFNIIILIIFVNSLLVIQNTLFGQWNFQIIDSHLDGSCFIYIVDINGDPDSDVAATGYLDNKVAWYENLHIVGIEQSSSEIARFFILFQNYPNPFNPRTGISWQLAVSSTVKLSNYNFTGQEVATLIPNSLSAGFHKYEWDASNLLSGIYLYRLHMGNYIETVRWF